MPPVLLRLCFVMLVAVAFVDAGRRGGNTCHGSLEVSSSDVNHGGNEEDDLDLTSLDDARDLGDARSARSAHSATQNADAALDGVGSAELKCEDGKKFAIVYPTNFYEYSAIKKCPQSPGSAGLVKSTDGCFNDKGWGVEGLPGFWLQCKSENANCAKACAQFCEDSVYYEHCLGGDALALYGGGLMTSGSFKMVATQKPETELLEEATQKAEQKAAVLKHCTDRCMADKCTGRCALCTDKGGQLPCPEHSECPDDLSKGYGFLANLASAEQLANARCQQAIDSRTYVSDVTVQGDQKKALVVTKAGIWHPKKTPLQIVQMGIKRVVCHEATGGGLLCDMYKKVICIVCKKDIATHENRRQLEAGCKTDKCEKNAENKGKQCVDDAMKRFANGTIDPEYSCEDEAKVTEMLKSCSHCMAGREDSYTKWLNGLSMDALIF